MKFAAYKNEQWLFDLQSDSEEIALKDAQERDPEVSHVDVVSETDGGGRAA